MHTYIDIYIYIYTHRHAHTHTHTHTLSHSLDDESFLSKIPAQADSTNICVHFFMLLGSTSSTASLCRSMGIQTVQGNALQKLLFLLKTLQSQDTRCGKWPQAPLHCYKTWSNYPAPSLYFAEPGCLHSAQALQALGRWGLPHVGRSTWPCNAVARGKACFDVVCGDGLLDMGSTSHRTLLKMLRTDIQQITGLPTRSLHANECR